MLGFYKSLAPMAAILLAACAVTTQSVKAPNYTEMPKRMLVVSYAMDAAMRGRVLGDKDTLTSDMVDKLMASLRGCGVSTTRLDVPADDIKNNLQPQSYNAAIAQTVQAYQLDSVLSIYPRSVDVDTSLGTPHFTYEASLQDRTGKNVWKVTAKQSGYSALGGPMLSRRYASDFLEKMRQDAILPAGCTKTDS